MRRRPWRGRRCHAGPVIVAALVVATAAAACSRPTTSGSPSPTPRPAAGPTAPSDTGGGGDPAGALEGRCGATREEAFPNLSITTVWRCYDVAGTDRRQIRQQLDRLGPVDGGRPFDAFTRWHVEWSYPATRRVAGSCRVAGEPAVSLLIEHVVPRWVERATGPPELAAEWSRYVAALQAHEDGHARIGRDVADRTLAALRRLATPNCAGFRRAAQETFDAILAEGRAAERRYDETTGHGAAQGARFG